MKTPPHNHLQVVRDYHGRGHKERYDAPSAIITVTPPHIYHAPVGYRGVILYHYHNSRSLSKQIIVKYWRVQPVVDRYICHGLQSPSRMSEY